ncbi:hypothetical protein MTO96_026989, partial [Rhipicephalus appendiculatus]
AHHLLSVDHQQPLHLRSKGELQAHHRLYIEHHLPLHLRSEGEDPCRDHRLHLGYHQFIILCIMRGQLRGCKNG